MFEPGDHGSTFGGGPLACAAAVAVMRTIEREGLVAHAAEAGDYLAESLSSLQDRGAPIAGVRGRGLMVGIGLTHDVARDVAAAALDAGLIINAIGTRTLRLVPPLIITRDEIDDAVARLGTAFDTVGRGRARGPGMSTAVARSAGAAAKPARHKAILDLVRGGVIRTQEDLVAELHRHSFEVTQATVSRDIRELGLLRVHDDGGPRYMAPVAELDVEQTMQRLPQRAAGARPGCRVHRPARHRAHRTRVRAARGRCARRIAVRGGRRHDRRR